jgi:hypothetical protein
MEPMTDELKETIIREHPDGIWLVACRGERARCRHGWRSTQWQVIAPRLFHFQRSREWLMSSQPRVEGMELRGSDVASRCNVEAGCFS